MNKLSKILLSILICFAIIVGLDIWHPWHRQPVVFYAPVFYPLEVIEGDILILSDGSQMVIDHDMQINSIEIADGMITINVTKHVNLWDMLMGEKSGHNVSIYPAGTYSTQ